MLEAFQTALAVLASLGIGGGIVVALSSWLGKVWAARILEEDRARFQTVLQAMEHEAQRALERLRVETQKQVLVHRVQFETEFRSFLAVWGKFAEVRSAMAGLRPHKEILPLNDNFQERLAQRLKAFAKAINELKTAVHHHSPFYPEEIYKELLGAISVCDLAYDEVSIEGQEERSKDWYRRGEEQLSDLIRKGEIISSKIRQRIESLSSHD